MYNCFKDCLLSPRKIGMRTEMKTGKVVLYMLLLFILYTAFHSVYFISSYGVNPIINEAIYEDLKQAEVVDFQIVDGKLQGANVRTRSVYLKNLSTALNVDVTAVFSNYAMLEMPLYAKHLYVVFKLDHVEFFMPLVDYYDGIQEDGKVQISKSNGLLTAFNVKLTYEELELKNIDFNKNSKNYDFTVNTVSGQISDKFKLPFIIGSIPIMFVLLVLSMMGTNLMMAVLLKVFNQTLDLSFGQMFKICTLSSTISIIINIFSVALGSTFLSFVAEMVHVIYAIIAVRVAYMYKNITKAERTGETNEL